MSDTQQVGIQETLLVEPSSALLLSSPTLAELRCIAENRPACQLFECGADKFEVEISPQIEGQTLILWDASQVVPSDAGALTAQIEFSRYDVSASSAWSIVRAHALNIGIWQDPLQRVFGKNSNAYYRIAIRDVAGTVYRSLPTRAGDYIPKLMKHPLMMAGSDGIYVGGRPHPRGTGCFARYLGHYVRNGTWSLEEAVMKCSLKVAERHGLKDRGVIAEKMAADVIVFDPAKVVDRSTFENGKALAEGMKHVFVNGQAVLKDGERTAARPGRGLRRG